VKKIKSFFSRYRRRAFRLLISLSAVAVLFACSFSAFARSTYYFSVMAMDYCKLVRSDGSELVLTSDNMPDGVEFTSGGAVWFDYSVENPKSFYFEYPIKFKKSFPENYSVAEGYYKNNGFTFGLYGVTSSLPVPEAFYITVSLITPEKTIVCLDTYVSSYSALPYPWEISFPVSGLTSEGSKIAYNIVFDSPGALNQIGAVFSRYNYYYFYDNSFEPFLMNCRYFFLTSFEYLTSVLKVIVKSSALTVLCLAMPIVIFSVILLYRLKRT
jgi:hypothetical protein